MQPFPFWLVSPPTQPFRSWETALSREGWTVTSLAAYETFAAQAGQVRAGLALLNWPLLGPAGQPALSRLKSKAPLVSVLLTGPRTIPQDRIVRYFDAGADDFIPLATPAALLVAKLKAHLRRLLPEFASAKDRVQSPGGIIRLDRSKHLVEIRETAGHKLLKPHLTPTEFRLLATLLERPGAAVERSVLLQSLKSATQDLLVRPGTVDKHIESLRRKLGEGRVKIEAVYGVGYALRD